MRSLKVLSQLLTAIFLGIVLISVATALLEFTSVGLLRRISLGEADKVSMLNRVVLNQSLLALFDLALFLACIITFLIWFHRAHGNLKALGICNLRFKSGWAIGGFFVPILNLVRPYDVMKEVAIRSSQLPSQMASEQRQPISPVRHVQWWWGLFLLYSLVGNTSARLIFRAKEPGELIVAGWVSILTEAVEMPAAIVALFLVRRLTSFQESAAGAVGTQLESA